jgi:hypothetical protein
MNLARVKRLPAGGPDSVFELAEFLAAQADIPGAITNGRIAAASFERNRDASCAFRVQQQIEEWQRLAAVAPT